MGAQQMLSWRTKTRTGLWLCLSSCCGKRPSESCPCRQTGKYHPGRLIRLGNSAVWWTCCHASFFWTDGSETSAYSVGRPAGCTDMASLVDVSNVYLLLVRLRVLFQKNRVIIDRIERNIPRRRYDQT